MYILFCLYLLISIYNYNNITNVFSSSLNYYFHIKSAFMIWVLSKDWANLSRRASRPGRLNSASMASAAFVLTNSPFQALDSFLTAISSSPSSPSMLYNSLSHIHRLIGDDFLLHCFIDLFRHSHNDQITRVSVKITSSPSCHKFSSYIQCILNWFNCSAV